MFFYKIKYYLYKFIFFDNKETFNWKIYLSVTNVSKVMETLLAIVRFIQKIKLFILYEKYESVDIDMSWLIFLESKA